MFYDYDEDSDFSPYFEIMAKQKRMCPKCMKRQTRLKKSLTPNAAYEVCDCGYFQSLTAPENARVPWDRKKPWKREEHMEFYGGRSLRPVEQRKPSNVISFADIKKRKK